MARDRALEGNAEAMKKLILALLIVLLLFAGCDEVLENPTTKGRETTSEATSTTAIITVLHLRPEDKLQTEGLQVFFEEYGTTMKRLSDLLLDTLIDINWRTAHFSLRWNGSYYKDEVGNEVQFDENLREEIESFLRIAGAETNHEARVSASKNDGKRIIIFRFSGSEIDSSIAYMPDGYVKRTHPEPSIDPQESEVQLAENWYSYLY